VCLRTVARATLVVSLFAATPPTIAGEPASRATVRIEKRQVVEPRDKRLVLPHDVETEIHWHSDESGELHVHGYDLRIRLRPDTVVHTPIKTRATGRFPVTSHGFASKTGQTHGHGALLYIEVHPD
jgi:hypothetical protein